jgi:hypothetical protein
MIVPPEPGDLKAFAQRIVRLLEVAPVRYAICGSLAVMEYSEPRLSLDVDIMVVADAAQLGRFVVAVGECGWYVTPMDVILEQLLPRGRPFNVIDGESGSKADIYPVPDAGLHGSALHRRRERVWDVASGETAWFLSPEDVILFKLDFYRQGGEVSQKHPADIAKMIAVMGGDLDTAYVERWATDLQVLDLWRRLWRLKNGD